jgi:ELWxxDGT repeat protein
MTSHRIAAAAGGAALLVAGLGSAVAAAQVAAPPAQLVKDINTVPTFVAPMQSQSEESLAIGNIVFFTMSDRVHGLELWRTNGTPRGTFILADVAAGTASSGAGAMRNVNGTLYFQASEVTTQGLWKSDGTPQGTVQVRAFESLQLGAALGSVLMFWACDSEMGCGLWKSDGTWAGTTLVKKDVSFDFSASAPFLSAGNLVFFYAADAAAGYELWRSDGTAAGTFRVKDIFPGPASSNHQWSEYAVLGNELLFTAVHPSLGLELWRSDGTAAGTLPVKDIHPGVPSSVPRGLTTAGDTLYFCATNPDAGRELWKSDGTWAGTRLVKDIAPGPASSDSCPAAAVGDTLFFFSTGGLWKTNGTPGGTVLATPLDGQWEAAGALGSLLLLWHQDSAIGSWQLWKSGGTAAGPTFVKNVGSGVRGPAPRVTVFGEQAAFLATEPSLGPAVWTTDATEAGTAPIKHTNLAANSSPQFLTAAGSALFFTAFEPATGRELWRSDGTAAGTTLVKDINPGAADSRPEDLVVLDGTVFFTAFDPATGRELWKSDGTEAGTMLVKDACPGPSPQIDGPYALAVFRQAVFFVTCGGLWSTDGTEAGTALVSSLPIGSGTALPSLMAVTNDALFIGGDALWKSDGTPGGTVLVKYINPEYPFSFAASLTAVGDSVFFYAYQPSSGYELWRSDGTEPGTVLVKDINPGPASSALLSHVFFWTAFPPKLVRIGDAVLFNARGPFPPGQYDAGRGVWRSDGTEAGTYLLRDLPPATRPIEGLSRLSSGVGVGDTYYFYLDDGRHGIELWKSDGTQAATRIVRDLRIGPSHSLMPGRPEEQREDLPMAAVYRWLMFGASGGWPGLELCITDGSATGTRIVQDIAPGAYSSSPHAFTAVGSQVFFVADDGATGEELWVVR